MIVTLVTIGVGFKLD